MFWGRLVVVAGDRPSQVPLAAQVGAIFCLQRSCKCVFYRYIETILCHPLNMCSDYDPGQPGSSHNGGDGGGFTASCMVGQNRYMCRTLFTFLHLKWCF